MNRRSNGKALAAACGGLAVLGGLLILQPASGLAIGLAVIAAAGAAYAVLGRAMAVAMSELRRWLSP